MRNGLRSIPERYTFTPTVFYLVVILGARETQVVFRWLVHKLLLAALVPVSYCHRYMVPSPEPEREDRPSEELTLSRQTRGGVFFSSDRGLHNGFYHSFFMMGILFCWREKIMFRDRETDSDDLDHPSAES